MIYGGGFMELFVHLYKEHLKWQKLGVSTIYRSLLWSCLHAVLISPELTEVGLLVNPLKFAGRLPFFGAYSQLPQLSCLSTVSAKLCCCCLCSVWNRTAFQLSLAQFQQLFQLCGNSNRARNNATSSFGCTMLDTQLLSYNSISIFPGKILPGWRLNSIHSIHEWCHCSTAITLCNQRLLQNVKLKKKRIIFSV